MASITWLNAVSADWSTASDWSGGIAPDSGDDVFLDAAGAYIVSIAAGESFTINSLNMSGGGTVAIAGSLDFDNASGSSFSVGSLTVDPGGLLSGEGILFGPGPVLNQGTMVGNAAIDDGGQSLFITPFSTFTNQGLLLATTGGNLDVDAGANGVFANIVGNVLTGGTYQADSVSTLAFVTPGATPAFTTIEASLILNGPGSAIDNNRSGTSTFTTVEDALTNIGTSGVLEILDGSDYIAGVALTDGGVLELDGGTLDTTGLTVSTAGAIIGDGTIVPAIANSGTVEAAGGFLTLAGGVSGAGALLVDADATMVLNGDFPGSITDDGTVQAQGGTLILSGPIDGGGGFVIVGSEGSQATVSENLPSEVLDLATANSGQVAFNGAGGELLLNSPDSFDGSVVGIGTGDTIVLAGIVADAATVSTGNILDVTDGGSRVYSMALSGDNSAANFSADNDGTNTTITVGGNSPRDYNFEGPFWQSKTITWSFATSNLAGDGGAPFSSFFDPTTQAAEEFVVEQALARWAAIAGLSFVEVPDAPSVDIRIGWGDLIGSGSGEIGQASYKFQANAMLPDGIVRLEDPAETALDPNAGVIGGLSYSGFSTTMYQVALHELGHALGLAHSTDPDAVMFPTAEGVVNQDADASDIAGIQTLYAAVACYVAGTSILTTRGELPVEALCAGDIVPGLVSGRLRRVRWIGRRSIDVAGHPQPHDLAPIRVRAGAFAPSMPHRDLLLSPEHALMVDGVLIPVRYLVNAATVLREAFEAVTYYHVELAGEDGAAVHEVMLAEGVPAESYLDTGNRYAFGNKELVGRKSAAPSAIAT